MSLSPVDFKIGAISEYGSPPRVLDAWGVLEVAHVLHFKVLNSGCFSMSDNDLWVSGSISTDSLSMYLDEVRKRAELIHCWAGMCTSYCVTRLNHRALRSPQTYQTIRTIRR